MEETQYSVTMPVSVWNKVLELLGDHPHNQVHPIITSIVQQVSGAMNPAPPEDDKKD